MLSMLLLSFALHAHAAEPSQALSYEAASVSKSQRAEYVRLSQEMERLAQRNAWSGVERAYVDCVDTTHPMTITDHINGAHAARAVGDVAAEAKRLRAAKVVLDSTEGYELSVEKDLIEWIAEIDKNYTHVFLACDPGSREFKPAAMPFNPVHARSVKFAIDKIQVEGLFDGYLPEGTYHFGQHEIRLQPGVQGEHIDLRSEKARSKRKKKK